MLRRSVLVVSEPPTFRNVDFLAWFSDDERQLCESCGERSAVTVPAAVASFCLGCGAVTIDGARVDVDSRLPGESDSELGRPNHRETDEPGVLVHRHDVDHPMQPAVARDD
jgi:hypothetical protein